MPFNRVMIDLETMSIAKDAAIIAIGAVRMDLEAEIVDVKEHAFYSTVSLKSAQRMGGKIDADTVLWWMEQSQEARDAITKDQGVHLETALKNFNTWIREYSCIEVWGNGSDFDNVILESAYNRLGWTPPWTYKMNRCYRTMANIFPQVKRDTVMEGRIAHNASDDAINQAEHLCKIWKLI